MVLIPKVISLRNPQLIHEKLVTSSTLKKRHATSKISRELIDDHHNAHVLEAHGGYDRNYQDKQATKISVHQWGLYYICSRFYLCRISRPT
jgi:hypothetical protein